MAKPTLELLFGYAMWAGALALAIATVRTARRGWALDEEGGLIRREDSLAGWRTMQAFQLAGIFVLVLAGCGVLGMLGW